MIIWSGLGFVVGLIFVGTLLLANLFTNSVFNEHYYTTHGWPKLLALWAAGLICWPVGRALNRGKEERELFDPKTGETVRVASGGGHSFFFVPVEYWLFVFFVLGIVFAFV